MVPDRWKVWQEGDLIQDTPRSFHGT